MSWQRRVLLELGDITQCDTEAIVNSANSELWMGSGVAGALKRAGGSSIEQEALAQGPINVGDCVLTSGGNLPSLYVIHAAVMPPGRPATVAAVQAATASALRLAVQGEIESIAFPALGTGVGGLSFEDCAQGMFHALAAHYARESLPEEVHIVLYGENALAVFEEVLKHWEDRQPDATGLAEVPV